MIYCLKLKFKSKVWTIFFVNIPQIHKNDKVEHLKKYNHWFFFFMKNLKITSPDDFWPFWSEHQVQARVFSTPTQSQTQIDQRKKRMLFFCQFYKAAVCTSGSEYIHSRTRSRFGMLSAEESFLSAKRFVRASENSGLLWLE